MAFDGSKMLKNQNSGIKGYQIPNSINRVISYGVRKDKSEVGGQWMFLKAKRM